MSGPLKGLRVLEFAGMGPAPFCAMVMSDLGAEVIRIDRPGKPSARQDVLARGRLALPVDLRDSDGLDNVRKLIDRADVLIEGFRPGVMERLGLGPDACLQTNARLVYGRMTGWGQAGPLAQMPGHDINYIALTGVLHAIGRDDECPPPPLNLVGDFGGGGMLLAVGILAALQEVHRTGRGQVVDAAMTDGSSLLSAFVYGMKAGGQWSNRRGENLLDGGAPFYGTYVCADGRYIAIGAIEPEFYRELLDRCGIRDPLFSEQMDVARWPLQKLKLREVFRGRTRDEWCAVLQGFQTCFAPVLDWDEATEHPHNKARDTYLSIDGLTQPAPAPRFSLTPASRPVPVRLASMEEALDFWPAPEQVL